jgi:GrpB-like predicted nucleotidyltransferase (UPF0157 family)
MVSVDDPDDEPGFLPALEQAGYVLRVREPGHRMLRTPELDVHVHLWLAGGEDEDRHLAFRDRLRRDEAARAEYEQHKRDLAGRFRDMNDYAQAKGALIAEILARSDR